MKNSFIFTFTSLVLLITIQLPANDTAVGLDGGEITFKKVDSIQMYKERLYISKNLVKVMYEFKNTSDKDVSLDMAFPLEYETCADKNFKHEKDIQFLVEADGKKIPTRFSQIYSPPQGSCENKKVAFLWKQTFGAKKTTIVKHQYTPIYTTGIDYGDDYLEETNKIQKESLVESFCVSKKQAEKAVQKKSKVYYLNYILQTANNWRGSIADFELEIDKGLEKNFVFLCSDLKITRKSNTKYSAKKKDYTPSTDLKIAFVISE